MDGSTHSLATSTRGDTTTIKSNEDNPPVKLDLEHTLSIDEGELNSIASLGRARKNILLCCFCLSSFIDGAGTSAAFLSTAPFAADLHISMANEAWVPTSYSLAFASTLLLAGRLSDMFAPKWVFTTGYAGMGAIYLIISFMNDQYAFFAMRAVSALFAVLTIPSAVNMIIQMFPDPKQRTRKLALFGLAGGLSAAVAPILVGLFLLSSWRWYFRFITCIAIPFAGLSAALLPKTERVAKLHGTDVWKQLDLGGVAIMIAMLVLFILGFTQAGISGWASPAFLAPLIISVVVLFPGFILWERYVAGPNALLPRGVTKYPNFAALMVGTTTVVWFSAYQMRTAVYWQSALGDSSILTAAKLLPMGLLAVVGGSLSQFFPKLITHPRFMMPLCCGVQALSMFLLAFSGGGWGTDYWKWVFPGQVVGTFAAMTAFVSMNTLIILSFPREYAGVAGSFATVVFQVSITVGIALQAGIVSTGKGGTDWTGDRDAYLLFAAHSLVAGVLFMFLWKQPDEKEEVVEAPSV